MPRNNSWDGKWSGEGKLYCRVRSYKFDPKNPDPVFGTLEKGGHYYDFGDGWAANVDVREVDAGEAAKYRRKSRGFCGYDWMIDSIEKHGKIVAE